MRDVVCVGKDGQGSVQDVRQHAVHFELRDEPCGKGERLQQSGSVKGIDLQGVGFLCAGEFRSLFTGIGVR